MAAGLANICLAKKKAPDPVLFDFIRRLRVNAL
jgi:hypothetical protein